MVAQRFLGNYNEDKMELPDRKILFSVFVLGLIIFFLWPKIVSPKVELYRREKLSIALQSDYTDILMGLARTDDEFLGWETLSEGGIASFSAQTQEKLDLIEQRLNFWQKKSVPDDLKRQVDLNYEALLQGEELLIYFNEELSYLRDTEQIINFLKEDIEIFEKGGYAKIIKKPELIKEKRTEVEKFAQAVSGMKAPKDFEEFNEQLKKTVRAQVDFWANNEIAAERRTPTIHSQSFWVLKGDWESLAQIGERYLDVRQNEEFGKLEKEFNENLKKLEKELKDFGFL